MFGDLVATVQPAEVGARVAEGWMLLDVRTEDEWVDGRIAGSVHIPMDQLMQRLDEVRRSSRLRMRRRRPFSPSGPVPQCPRS